MKAEVAILLLCAALPLLWTNKQIRRATYGQRPEIEYNVPMLISASLIVQLVKNLPAMQETPIHSWVGKICWRRDRLPTPVFLGFPCGSSGKESACDAEDLGSIPGLGRSPGERKGYPLQWPGEFHGLYSPWGRKELDMTEGHSLTHSGRTICGNSICDQATCIVNLVMSE